MTRPTHWLRLSVVAQVCDNIAMIATLSGVVSEKFEESIVLDVHGVGYGLIVSASDFGRTNLGQSEKFHVYEHIREVSHDLYGFSNLESKKLFEQLLGVKGIGPKVAMAVLNAGNNSELKANIANGDVKYLQTAKGVGKRAAEQIIVELRDKVGEAVGEGAEAVIARAGVNVQDEALQALVALGYSEADAQIALHNVDSSLPTEDRIKKVLKG